MLTQTQTHTNPCSYTHVVIKQCAEAVSVRQAVITALKALEKFLTFFLSSYFAVPIFSACTRNGQRYKGSIFSVNYFPKRADTKQFERQIPMNNQ